MRKYKIKDIMEKISITIIVLIIISGPAAWIYMEDNGLEKYIGQATILALLIMIAFSLMIRSEDQLKRDRQAEKEKMKNKLNKLCYPVYQIDLSNYKNIDKINNLDKFVEKEGLFKEENLIALFKSKDKAKYYCESFDYPDQNNPVYVTFSYERN